MPSSPNQVDAFNPYKIFAVATTQVTSSADTSRSAF